MSICKLKYPNQYAKLYTRDHEVAGDEDGNNPVAGWFPIEMVAVLFTMQFCHRNGIELPDELYKLVEPPFSKWDRRTDWFIADLKPPGHEPSNKGWIEETDLKSER